MPEEAVVESSLNLTPHRGPSVWDTRAPRTRPIHLATAVAGIAVTALAWRASSRRRFWMAGLGAASTVAALMAGSFGDRADRALASARAKSRARSVEPLDRTLKDTFPASDAPAVW